jgi:hypothetical protein
VQLEPDEPLAGVGGLALISDVAGQYGGDRLEGFGGDGDADQCPLSGRPVVEQSD